MQQQIKHFEFRIACMSSLKNCGPRVWFWLRWLKKERKPAGCSKTFGSAGTMSLLVGIGWLWLVNISFCCGECSRPRWIGESHPWWSTSTSAIELEKHIHLEQLRELEQCNGNCFVSMFLRPSNLNMLHVHLMFACWSVALQGKKLNPPVCRI